VENTQAYNLLIGLTKDGDKKITRKVDPIDDEEEAKKKYPGDYATWLSRVANIDAKYDFSDPATRWSDHDDEVEIARAQFCKGKMTEGALDLPYKCMPLEVEADGKRKNILRTSVAVGTVIPEWFDEKVIFNYLRDFTPSDLYKEMKVTRQTDCFYVSFPVTSTHALGLFKLIYMSIIKNRDNNESVKIFFNLDDLSVKSPRFKSPRKSPSKA
jgi:hypothetical protein